MTDSRQQETSDKKPSKPLFTLFLDSGKEAVDKNQLEKALTCCIRAREQKEISPEALEKSTELLLEIGEVARAQGNHDLILEWVRYTLTQENLKTRIDGFTQLTLTALEPLGELYFKTGAFQKALTAAKMIIYNAERQYTQMRMQAFILAGSSLYAEFHLSKKTDIAALVDSTKHYEAASRIDSTVAESKITLEKRTLDYLYDHVMELREAKTTLFSNLYIHCMYYQEARLLVEQHKLTMTAEISERVERLIRQSFTYFNNGMIWFEYGTIIFDQFQKAPNLRLKVDSIIEALKKAEESGIQNPNLYLKLAICYSVKENYQDGLNYFMRTLEFGIIYHPDELLKTMRHYLNCQVNLIKKELESINPEGNAEEKKENIHKKKILSRLNPILTQPYKSLNQFSYFLMRAERLDEFGLLELALNDYRIALWLFDTEQCIDKMKSDDPKGIILPWLWCYFKLSLELLNKGSLIDSGKYYSEFFQLLCQRTLIARMSLFQPDTDQKRLSASVDIGKVFKKVTRGHKSKQASSLNRKSKPIKESHATNYLDSVNRFNSFFSDNRLELASAELYKLFNFISIDMSEDQVKTILNSVIAFYLKNLFLRVRQAINENQEDQLHARTSLENALVYVGKESPKYREIEAEIDHFDTAVRAKKSTPLTRVESELKEHKKKSKKAKSQQRIAPKAIITESAPAVDEEKEPQARFAEPVETTVSHNPIESTAVTGPKKELKETSSIIPGVKILHPSAVSEIYKKFEEHDIKRIYTVGGYVCEAIKPAGNVTDYDFVFGIQNDPLKLLKEMFPDADIEQLINEEEEKSEDKVYIITLENGLKFDVCHSQALSDISLTDEEALKKDASKRDFTANALYAKSNGEAYDPTGRGFYDLCRTRKDLPKLGQSGQLKCIYDMKKSFRDDPIRALRAINFCNKRNWNITSNMFEAIESLEPQLILNKLLEQRPGRTNSWVYKIFSNGYAVANFNLLLKHKFFHKLFPDLAEHLETNESLKNAIEEEFKLADFQASIRNKINLYEIYFNLAQHVANTTGKPFDKVIEQNLLFKKINFPDYEKAKSAAIIKEPVKVFSAVLGGPMLPGILTAMQSADAKAINQLTIDEPSKLNRLLNKIFCEGRAIRNFFILRQANVFKMIFPELDALINQDDKNEFVNLLKKTDELALANGKPDLNIVYLEWINFISRKTKKDVDVIKKEHPLFTTNFNKCETIIAASIERNPFNLFNTILSYAQGDMQLVDSIKNPIKSIGKEIIEEKVKTNPDRINKILNRLLGNPKADNYFKILFDCNVIQKLFPGLGEAIKSHHSASLFNFILGKLLTESSAAKPNLELIYAPWVIIIASAYNKKYEDVIAENPLFKSIYAEINIHEQLYFINIASEYNRYFKPPLLSRSTLPLFEPSTLPNTQGEINQSALPSQVAGWHH